MLILLSVIYCGRFWQSVLCFCNGVVQLYAKSQLARKHQQIYQAREDLDSHLHIEEFVDKAKNWNIVKQQHVYSTATFHHQCNLFLVHSQLAIL